MASLNSTEGRAKYIYNFLKSHGCGDTCCVAIMGHLYRTTDGMTYPYNKITIDTKGKTGKQLGGGLRGYIYSVAVNMCKRYSVGNNAIEKLTAMNNYAQSCGQKPLTKGAEKAMNTRFPEGFPVPIDVQLQDIIDTINKKCPEIKNGSMSGKEMSQIFRNINNPKLGRPDGRWDHHSAQICKQLGLDINKLNNTPTSTAATATSTTTTTQQGDNGMNVLQWLFKLISTILGG